ncbi:MAG: dihydrodipicolinate synthase family protein [Candidatus Acidiferrales bacterium]
MNLHGIFPPVTAPFAADGSLALEHLSSNIARYNKTRLAGFVANGSTGESVLLTWPEIERIWATVRDAASLDKTLIAGTGAESTLETIEHTNRAAALGYHAALVRTPSYYRPQMTLEAEAAHFLRVADAAKIPVLIYSVPIFTGYTVEAPLVARLAAHPNIIGMKDSSGDVAGVAKIIAAAPRNFQTLVGSAKTLYASLEKGAIGAILAVACALPELCVDLYEAARSGRLARAQQLQEALEPFSAVASSRGIAALKYALDKLGYYGGLARLPLLPPDETAKREVDDALARASAVTSPAS